MTLFRGSSRFESLILSHHSRFTCECNKEEINDDNDDKGSRTGRAFSGGVSACSSPAWLIASQASQAAERKAR